MASLYPAFAIYYSAIVLPWLIYSSEGIVFSKISVYTKLSAIDKVSLFHSVYLLLMSLKKLVG